MTICRKSPYFLSNGACWCVLARACWLGFELTFVSLKVPTPADVLPGEVQVTCGVSFVVVTFGVRCVTIPQAALVNSVSGMQSSPEGGSGGCGWDLDKGPQGNTKQQQQSCNAATNSNITSRSIACCAPAFPHGALRTLRLFPSQFRRNHGSRSKGITPTPLKCPLHTVFSQQFAR